MREFLLGACFLTGFVSAAECGMPSALRDGWLCLTVGNDSTVPAVPSSGDEHWQVATLPHCYNLSSDPAHQGLGVAWYYRKLKIPLHDTVSETAVLTFEGVCLRATVYVNGRIVCRSPHGYLPFSICLDTLTRPGAEVDLLVRVDNRLVERSIPDDNCDGWWFYGGIIRDVFLFVKNRRDIGGVQTRTTFVSSGRFRFGLVAHWQDGRAPDSVVVAIKEPSGKLLWRTGCSVGRSARVALSTELSGTHEWSPDDPFLYTVEVVPYRRGLSYRPYSLKRGFAQLEVDSSRLLLNGRPVFLRGVSRHDVAQSKGPLLTRNERLQDLVRVKDLGANFVRITHFPQHQDVYELCDSIGLMVLDEIPVWKTSPEYLGSVQGQRETADYMDGLIEQHGNHVCVAVWCMANEIHSVAGRVAEYVKFMAGHIRSRDSTRLITYTSYFYQFDKAYQYVDVISVNEYFGWFLGSVAMLHDLFLAIHKDNPTKPIIVTEFGSSSMMGQRNPNAKLAGVLASMLTKDFSEDYQAILCRAQVKAAWQDRSICSGCVVWCLADYMQPGRRPNHPDLVPGLSGMGLLTEGREKKLAFDAVAEQYGIIAAEMRVIGGN